MDTAFLQASIVKTEAKITLYEDAILAFADPTVQRYTLDSGQNAHTVSRQDLDMLTATVNSLYNTLSTMCIRLNGSGAVLAQPAW